MTVPSSGSLYVGGWSEAQSWTGTYHSTSSVTSQTWHHVAAVLDAGAGTFDAYLDGVLFGTGFGGTLNNHELVTFGVASTPGGTQYHDGDIQPGSTQDFFYGYVDEFRAYNRSLALAEIQENMHREITNDQYGTNIICYYQFY